MRLLYIFWILLLFFLNGCAPVPKVVKRYFPSPQFPEENFTKRFIWPVKGEVISFFGEINSDRVNKGIDIKTDVKQKVRASSDGEVVFCGEIRGFGLTIIIRHSKDIYTLYSNNAESFVKLHDSVKKGEIISLVGIDPWSKKSVLHFEFRKDKKPVNPLLVLEGG